MPDNNSYREGKKAGHKFIARARKHPIAHSIDPFYNSKPYRSKDRAFNEGVRKGIREKESKCFLSSACTTGVGLRNNCYELAVLRRFRDEHLLRTAAGATEVRRYYEIAPRIVSAINAARNSSAIYVYLYHCLVVPCVLLIEAGRPEHARLLYRRMVDKLDRSYNTPRRRT